MNTETRYDRPFITADPSVSGPVFYQEEECHDPGTCYPTDDGEADIVDPGPAPVSGAGSQPSGLFPRALNGLLAGLSLSLLAPAAPACA